MQKLMMGSADRGEIIKVIFTASTYRKLMMQIDKVFALTSFSIRSFKLAFRSVSFENLMTDLSGNGSSRSVINLL
jgi:hypothetical protein